MFFVKLERREEREYGTEEVEGEEGREHKRGEGEVGGVGEKRR